VKPIVCKGYCGGWACASSGCGATCGCNLAVGRLGGALRPREGDGKGGNPLPCLMRPRGFRKKWSEEARRGAGAGFGGQNSVLLCFCRASLPAPLHTTTARREKQCYPAGATLLETRTTEYSTRASCRVWKLGGAVKARWGDGGGSSLGSPNRLGGCKSSRPVRVRAGVV
jgi:hypothetical protein